MDLSMLFAAAAPGHRGPERQGSESGGTESVGGALRVSRACEPRCRDLGDPDAGSQALLQSRSEAAVGKPG